MPMPDECLPLINTIQDNITIAQTLIQELKKFIDVADHEHLIKRIEERLHSLDNILNVAAEDITKLIAISVDVATFVNELQHSLYAVRFNQHDIKALRAFAPEFIDSAISGATIKTLSQYMCGQFKIIESMLDFCNVARNENGKIFEFFNKNDIESKWLGIRDIKLGVCFGLGALFMLCSFITDMQRYKTVNSPEDDLRWFYRCIVLLQLQPYEYSITQQQDITRFISLVMHLQNSKITCGMDFNVFDSSKEISFSQQCSNLFNVTFSGTSHIKYLKGRSIHDASFINFLLNTAEPLYIMFGLHDKLNPGHLVVLLKNSSGEFKFYEPSVGVRDVVLNNELDYLIFKNNYLIANQTIVSMTLGITCKDQNKPLKKRIGTEADPNSTRKRLKFSS
jgi:hypothetical protein